MANHGDAVTKRIEKSTDGGSNVAVVGQFDLQDPGPLPRAEQGDTCRIGPSAGEGLKHIQQSAAQTSFRTAALIEVTDDAAHSHCLLLSADSDPPPSRIRACPRDPDH